MPRIKELLPQHRILATNSPQFTVASTCDGYEVQDNHGRSMTGSFCTANRPLEIAGDLNNAARHGVKQLARALGCLESEATMPWETVEAFEHDAA